MILIVEELAGAVVAGSAQNVWLIEARPREGCEGCAAGAARGHIAVGIIAIRAWRPGSLPVAAQGMRLRIRIVRASSLGSRIVVDVGRSSTRLPCSKPTHSIVGEVCVRIPGSILEAVHVVVVHALG